MQVLTDEYALENLKWVCLPLLLLGESGENLKEDSSPLVLLGESTELGDSGSSEARDVNEVVLTLLLSSCYSGIDNSISAMAVHVD